MCLIFNIILFLLVAAYYTVNADDFVVTTEKLSTSKETSNKDEKVLKPELYELMVEANVTNRFSKTRITSKVINSNVQARSATFSVVLPEQAFISDFVMEVGGKQYRAYIKEKEEAKRSYDKAVDQGQSAAHVTVNARDSNRFTVDVNIEARSKAIFYLTYEELLERKLEMYEVVLNIQPGEPVKDLKVQVNINESRPLKFVRSPALRSGNEISKNSKANLNPNADIHMIDIASAIVKFNPDLKKQEEYAKELGTNIENGLAGQFIVQYEVERDPQGGEVLLNEGFFVHFFAPTEMQSIPKYVIFILDTSGSMSGMRLTQLKEAMENILSELKPEDAFSLVEFEFVTKVWDVKNEKLGYQGLDMYASQEINNKVRKLPPAYDATDINIEAAKRVINKFEANGGTDIDQALKIGLELIDQNKQIKKQPMIVFLTDGEATGGETNIDVIITSVTDLNIKRTPIFTLSFGDDADKIFLQRLSLKNFGFARHIYEGADAGLQLIEFYKDISSPLLTNIKFKYLSNVTEVTRSHFPILFFGGELVVAGLTPIPSNNLSAFSFNSSIEAQSRSGQILLRPKVETPVTSLERLWAYLTVKQLLTQRDVHESRIVEMALKYSFVTEVTSLVAVKPNTTLTVKLEDASQSVSGKQLKASFQIQKLKPISTPLNPSSVARDSFDIGDRDYLMFDVDPLTTTHRTPSRQYQKIITSLPWLSTVLSPNGILTTQTGNLRVNFGKNNNNYFQCKLPEGDQLGICKGITLCPQIYDKLVNLQIFLRYTCPQNRRIGICCPQN